VKVKKNKFRKSKILIPSKYSNVMVFLTFLSFLPPEVYRNKTIPLKGGGHILVLTPYPGFGPVSIEDEMQLAFI
jgi:hypothetical protein